MSSVSFSLIIPCYDEGPTFEASVKKIISSLKKLKIPWEIIFVEDKSKDETAKKVENIVKKFENTRAIFHHKNFGRGKTVNDGIFAAKGKICGYLDVDLEISESYIPLFIKEVENGSDMVVGKRFYEVSAKSIMRFVASKFYSNLVRAFLKLEIEDTEAGYKFFRRSKILPVLRKTKDKGWFWDTEICLRASRAGLVLGQIPVLFIRRPDKKSTVKLIPDTVNYLFKIIRFSQSN
ncbi:MAG: glycosyltransferase family 2 protein [Candidatus Curtissbacteria bacterium]|nr:glycosyltransferase family 2 protein [Candidatus Curtissbacteria bacterium]